MTTEVTWKKLAAASILAVMVAGGYNLIINTATNVAKAGTAAGSDVYGVLVEAANARNATLPMMLDKETRLDMTIPGPGGNTFIHYLTLPTYNSAELESVSAMDALTRFVSRATCGLTEKNWYFERGVSLVYVYRGNDGQEIGKVTVTRTDCEKLNVAAPAPKTKAVAQQEYYDLTTLIDEILAEEANTENAKLPRMVDKETRLDTTFSHGPRFTYMYTIIGFTSAELKATKFMAGVKANKTAETCGSTVLEPYLQRGAKFNHVLRGSDQREIGRFSVALADCEKTKI